MQIPVSHLVIYAHEDNRESVQYIADEIGFQNKTIWCVTLLCCRQRRVWAAAVVWFACLGSGLFIVRFVNPRSSAFARLQL